MNNSCFYLERFLECISQLNTDDPTVITPEYLSYRRSKERRLIQLINYWRTYTIPNNRNFSNFLYSLSISSQKNIRTLKPLIGQVSDLCISGIISDFIKSRGILTISEALELQTIVTNLILQNYPFISYYQIKRLYESSVIKCFSYD